MGPSKELLKNTTKVKVDIEKVSKELQIFLINRNK